MALAKSLYSVPTWTRTVALVREHAALRATIAGDGDVPSVYACYRFAAKLRTYRGLLDACLARVTAALHARLPDMSRNVAIDASDLPAYANGQRYVSKNASGSPIPTPPGVTARQSRPARAAASTATGSTRPCARIPASRSRGQVSTAASHESNYVAPLLNTLARRGFAVETCAMDKGYDVGNAYAACDAATVQPIVPLRNTPAVARGRA